MAKQLANPKVLDTLGAGLESAICDTLQLLRGQEVSVEAFMQNIVANLIAAGVGS